ncbi:uncharacterized protein [Pyrus communis]|uniref:uncharacterized protein n=1 Tax=Pyrus communis TaxID=23211 RepID=UPI0035C00BF9
MGDSKSVEASNDPSSPFYIHYSDNPGMHLVSTLLTGNNYSTWSRSMRIALSAKNKFGFVDGSVKKPSDKKATEAALWQRYNDMVLMWILNSVNSGLSNSVVYAETAHAVWDDLKTRFSQDTVPRIFEIQRDIARLTQNQMSVSDYYSQLKGLWDELSSYDSHKNCSCGIMEDRNEKEEQNKVM